MHRRDRRTPRIFLTRPARDHGRRGHAQPHGYAENDGEHAFGERNGGDGIGAETRYEEHIHDSKERLHGHFEDHGNGQQKDSAADGAFGEILMRPDERVMQIVPDASVGFRRGRTCRMLWRTRNKGFATFWRSMQYSAECYARP